MATKGDGIVGNVRARTAGLVGVLTAATAVSGSIATDPKSAWYTALDKPAWQPPGAVFPIVWTALYASIGVASVAALLAASSIDLARRAGRAGRGPGLALVLYAAWCTFATALTAEIARRNPHS